ncbi:DUF883 family protein [Hyphococcus sp.]|uniref:DUF883 family protein n=1 Tax=Hyphococcus sp. TaxID=2038636 RepID=UPI003CCBEB1A
MAVAEKNNLSESTSSETNAAYKQVSDDLKSLRDDLKALRHDFTSLSESAAGDAKQRLKDGFESAEEQTREAFDSAASELQEIQLQAEKAVKKKPITAVAAALAIGYFIGGVVRR